MLTGQYLISKIRLEQLVYLYSGLLSCFGSVMVGRIGQSDLWNLLLSELIF